MKVLMTTDTAGGVWTFALSLCKALEHHDVDVALATMGRPLSSGQREQAAMLKRTELHESDYSLCWMPDSASDVEAAGAWLLELEQKVAPDLVHSNDLAHGGLPWQSPVLLTAHSCVFSWWRAVKNAEPPEWEWALYKRWVQASVDQASLVTAPSSAMLKVFQHIYGNASRCCVVANGRDWPALAVDPHKSARRIKRHPTMRLRHMAPKEGFIFTAGRVWDEAKNLGLLAKAAADLSWPVYVAGDYGDLGKPSPMPRHVHCLGQLDEAQLADWFARAQIYAAPALYEPFGLAILEAARAGCALLLSDIPSLREVWGDNALYAPADDAELWHHELRRLVRNPALRLRKASQAWQHAQRYSARAMADAYFHHYRELTTNNHHTGLRKAGGRP